MDNKEAMRLAKLAFELFYSMNPQDMPSREFDGLAIKEKLRWLNVASGVADEAVRSGTEPRTLWQRVTHRFTRRRLQ